jgi:hypothetical protein
MLAAEPIAGRLTVAVADSGGLETAMHSCLPMSRHAPNATRATVAVDKRIRVIAGADGPAKGYPPVR